MRLIYGVHVVCVALVLVCLTSCDDVAGPGNDEDGVAKHFASHKCGDSPDYAIEIQSSVDPMQWDHVITVHGYVDDFDAAQRLVEYLNRTGVDNHRCVPLNK